MKNRNLLFTFLIILIIGLFNFIQGQTVLTLQPDASEGKDALLHGLASEVSTNYGDHTEILATAWTFSEVPGNTRSIFEFDLSSIPTGSTISSSYLSLYAQGAAGNGPHSTESGSNKSWIRRITTNWNEYTVTWNIAPTSTTHNQVLLPPTSYDDEDFPNIDVTQLVQDMIDDPANSYGFLIRLKTEDYYRRMVFCSSDHSDTTRHPKLVVTYTTPDAIFDNEQEQNLFEIFPNPTSDLINIDIISTDNAVIEIYNVDGQLILSQPDIRKQEQIDISRWTNGCYFIKLITNNTTQTRKVIKY